MSCDISTLLQQDSATLQSALSLDTREARIEAQMLLQSVLNVNRAYLLAHPERELSEVETSAYRVLLQRRLAGEPIESKGSTIELFSINPSSSLPEPVLL